MHESRTHLAEVIGERTLHVTDPKLLAKEVAAYLLTEYRTADLDSLIRDIMQYRAEHGHVEAEVITAHELPAEITRELKQLLKDEYPKAKDLKLRETIDSSIIGGLRLRLPNEQLDLSVQAQLAKFKRLTTEGKGIS